MRSEGSRSSGSVRLEIELSPKTDSPFGAKPTERALGGPSAETGEVRPDGVVREPPARGRQLAR